MSLSDDLVQEIKDKEEQIFAIDGVCGVGVNEQDESIFVTATRDSLELRRQLETVLAGRKVVVSSTGPIRPLRGYVPTRPEFFV